MTYKWKTNEAAEYARNFASLITKEFFASTPRISGADILQITEIKQVNLLTIKLLYDKWQEESRKMKSPYFDYTVPEVQEAYQNFVNILSRNIAVDASHFEQLLAESTYQTLWISLEPKDYFLQLFKNLPDGKLSKSWIDQNSRYFPGHKEFFAKIISKMGSEQVNAHSAFDLFDPSDFKSADQEEILSDFDKILSLNALETQSNKNTSFFDDAIASTPIAAPKLQPTQEPREPIQVKEKNGTSLNDQLNKENRTLNERMVKKETDVALQKAKISNVKEGVSFNQRYLFVYHLFGGDLDAYNQTMAVLDTFNSFQEAEYYLHSNISTQYNWAKYEVEVEEFYQHIQRRYL